VDVIHQFNDPRIKLEVLKRNGGMNVAVAHCMKRCSGKYIANMCSDDVWHPEKLEKQVRFLEENEAYDAVFTRVSLVNEKGRGLKSLRYSLYPPFDCENKLPHEWLNRFFYNGNCLCNPSVLIKREVYEKYGYQDKRLISLSDFDLWIKLSFEHKFWVLDERLTSFRMRSGKKNVSAATKRGRNRGSFEYKQILDNYLNIKDTQTLLKVFPECVRYGEPQDSAIPYFLGRLAVDTGRVYTRLWGLEKIYAMMADEKMCSILEDKYDFRYADLIRLTGETNVFYVTKLKNLSQKLKKYFKKRLKSVLKQ
jgi:glycosyltransferase involved in cell wall biosynthesis